MKTRIRGRHPGHPAAYRSCFALTSLLASWLLLAGIPLAASAAGYGEQQEQRMIPFEILLMQMQKEFSKSYPGADIDFTHDTLPAGWKAKTTNKASIANGIFQAHATNGTATLEFRRPDGYVIDDFTLTFDCGFDTAYWGTQCEVTFYMVDGSEITFWHGNKPHNHGEKNVTWFGDAANRQISPFGPSVARYTFLRLANPDATMIDNAIRVSITPPKGESRWLRLAEKEAVRGTLNVSRIMISAHNTTAKERAWLDNVSLSYN